MEDIAWFLETRKERDNYDAYRPAIGKEDRLNCGRRVSRRKPQAESFIRRELVDSIPTRSVSEGFRITRSPACCVNRFAAGKGNITTRRVSEGCTNPTESLAYASGWD